MNNICIGILTFHNAMNYGAILQCYALQEFLDKIGFTVKVINYTPNKFKLIYNDPKDFSARVSLKRKIKNSILWCIRFKSTLKKSRKFNAFNYFITSRFFLTEPIIENSCIELNKQIDIFIVGRHLVVSAPLTYYDEYHFLNFVAEDKKKISYAASLKTQNDEGTEELIKNYLPSFDAISVREQNAVGYLKEKFGINSVCVLDPTFLLTHDKWLQVANEKCKRVNGKYILIYLVSQQEKLLDYAFDYAKSHKLIIISLSPLKGKRGYKDFSDSSIEQFLGLINNAECVFTTSFHGLALSINLHTDFYFEVSDNSHNNNDRLLDITQKLGLSNRNVVNGIADKDIDWDEVESKLNILRNKSMDFLENAIGMESNEK